MLTDYAFILLGQWMHVRVSMARTLMHALALPRFTTAIDLSDAWFMRALTHSRLSMFEFPATARIRSGHGANAREAMQVTVSLKRTDVGGAVHQCRRTARARHLLHTRRTNAEGVMQEGADSRGCN